MELQPKRKTIRLKGYDYSTPGMYFITICTKNRKQTLSKIVVGTGVLDGPKNVLTPCGLLVEKHILNMSDFYEDIKVDKFVIMPNHIHLLLQILEADGPSGRPVPTDAPVSRFVGTLKRFSNKEYGNNIWQARSHDHVIRGEKDYQKIWQYIDTNVLRWEKDCFYENGGSE